MSSRAIAPGADGSFTLRSGRLYRLLVLINGPPAEAELEGALVKSGFSEADLALSSERTWRFERPHDWPAEPLPAIAANEQLARISGSFMGGTIRIRPDTPIAGGGTFTILAAWDYGPARAHHAPEAEGETTGAARPRPDPMKVVLLAGSAAALTGIGWAAWRAVSLNRRVRRDEERLKSLALRADRARMAGRVRALMSEGHTPRDAEAIAATERDQGFKEDPDPHACPQCGAPQSGERS